jgi:hypothetical protein
MMEILNVKQTTPGGRDGKEGVAPPPYYYMGSGKSHREEKVSIKKIGGVK